VILETTNRKSQITNKSQSSNSNWFAIGYWNLFGICHVERLQRVGLVDHGCAAVPARDPPYGTATLNFVALSLSRALQLHARCFHYAGMPACIAPGDCRAFMLNAIFSFVQATADSLANVERVVRLRLSAMLSGVVRSSFRRSGRTAHSCLAV
jgi:hypothetical protein